MSQETYYIENASGAVVRADLNDLFAAIVSQNSGATEPATKYAYQMWVDTTASVLKIRNSGNSAWITLPFSITADNTVDINGGTIDGISQLTLGSSVTVSSILDEDNLSSNSATALATQQSIKTYVDSQVTAQDLDFQGDSGGVLSIDLDSEIFTLNGGTGITSAGSENTISFSIDSTVTTLTGNQTLTNKSIDLDNNTLSNIEVDNLKSGVLDVDLSSASANDDTLASAKAIKSYVDTNITAQDLDITDGSATIAIDLDSETLSLLGGTGVTSAASGNGVTFSIGQAVGTSSNVQFGTVTANLTGQASDISNHSTSDLAEGSRLYYTDARFDTRLATKDTDDLTEGNNLYYNQTRFDSAFTAKSTQDLTEQTNLYFTNERVDDQVSTLIQGGTGISWVYSDGAGTLTPTITLSPFSTSSLSEGSNLYYTQARFDSAFSAKSTSDLSEGSNEYFTTTRANSAIDSKVNKAFVDALNIQAASVDANSVALGTDTTGNYVATIAGTNNQIEVLGSGSESAAVTISLPNDVSIANNCTVAGNLTVNGTLVSLNSTNLAIEDNLFELNAGLTGTPVNDTGMLINRGNQDNGVFMWDESADKFTLGLTTADGTSTGNITLSALGTLVANIEGNILGNVTGTVSSLSNHSTQDLAEQTNLYYTDARSRAAISASGDIAYNSSTGVISFTASAAPVTSVNSQTGAVVLTSASISENLNLYFTNARARAAISEGSTQLSYDSSTGVLTYTQGNSDTVSEGSSNLFYTDARVATKIDSYVDKSFVDSLSVVAASATGNSGSSTALATARTIGMTGDVVWTSASFDGSGNVTGTSEIQANAVGANEISTNAVGIPELNVSDGSNGQALTTDGSGTLAFANVAVSQTLNVVGRAASIAITITSGVLAVIGRSGTINVGV